MGDLKLKTRAIEAFDREIVGPAWRLLQAGGQPCRLVVATDHRARRRPRPHDRTGAPAVC